MQRNLTIGTWIDKILPCSASGCWMLLCLNRLLHSWRFLQEYKNWSNLTTSKWKDHDPQWNWKWQAYLLPSGEEFQTVICTIIGLQFVIVLKFTRWCYHPLHYSCSKWISQSGRAHPPLWPRVTKSSQVTCDIVSVVTLSLSHDCLPFSTQKNCLDLSTRWWSWQLWCCWLNRTWA